MPPLNNFQRSCLALAVSNALASCPVGAATINVDANCNLIDAITSANTEASVNTCTAGSGADTIVLPNGYVGSFPSGGFSYATTSNPVAVDSALPTITSEITIQGSGASNAIIERTGGTEFRIVAVAYQASLTLDSVTLRGGSLSLASSTGAGIYAYEASLNILNSTITNNSAANAAGIDLQRCGYFMMSNSTVSDNSAASAGGGIYAYNPITMSIVDSLVAQNTAGTTGGGIAVRGDGGSLTLSGSSITLNVASNATEYDYGGGIYVLDVSLNATEVSVSNNSARKGGGLYADDSIVVIETSTFADNTATESGAGIHASDSTAEIIKSTISGNSAAGEAGGLLHQNGDSFKVRDSTLSGNIAATGSALSLSALSNEIRNSTIYNNSATGAGPLAVSLQTATMPGVIVNTIVADSSQGDCYFGAPMNFVANNSSWFEDATCDGVGQGNPLLNSLAANNDGLVNSTLTHAPSLGSGVLGGGNITYCASGFYLTDQRGAARGAISCDIGAVEGSIAGPQDNVCFVVKAVNNNVTTFCL